MTLPTPDIETRKSIKRVVECLQCATERRSAARWQALLCHMASSLNMGHEGIVQPVVPIWVTWNHVFYNSAEITAPPLTDVSYTRMYLCIQDYI